MKKIQMNQNLMKFHRIKTFFHKANYKIKFNSELNKIYLNYKHILSLN